MPRPISRAGFTLVELLAVLLVLALLLGVAVPSFRTLKHNNLMYREATRLLAAVKLARSESLRRNLPVSLCASSMADSGEPECDGVYADGWVVFSNPDRDKAFDIGRDELIRVFDPLPPQYTLTNRAGDRDISELLTYLPDGSSRRAITLMLCSPEYPLVASRSVILNRVGRPRMAWGFGQCPGS